VNAALGGSAPMFYLDRAGIICAFCGLRSSSRARLSRASVSTQSQHSTANFALFVCRCPMQCQVTGYRPGVPVCDAPPGCSFRQNGDARVYPSRISPRPPFSSLRRVSPRRSRPAFSHAASIRFRIAARFWATGSWPRSVAQSPSGSNAKPCRQARPAAPGSAGSGT